jgi:hypothetical protein
MVACFSISSAEPLDSATGKYIMWKLSNMFLDTTACGEIPVETYRSGT